MMLDNTKQQDIFHKINYNRKDRFKDKTQFNFKDSKDSTEIIDNEHWRLVDENN